MKKLLYILAVSVPSELNIQKLASIIGASRRVVYDHLEYLREARLTNSVKMGGAGYRILNKTEKILLENSNVAYALTSGVNTGSIRETFFVNQVLNSLTTNPKVIESDVMLSKTGDFLVKGDITFEIGGKSKTARQIRNIQNAYIVADGIEFGHGNKIPLWLYGFLY